ncbi:MAG: hypothetical protein Q4C65_06795 [Eubacteriales bacterium]|nr:hypothetical protein [Eubacteriales bacterium]
MKYQSERLALRKVREVYRGRVNDIDVCEDRDTGVCFTVLTVKDHAAVRELLEVFERGRDGTEGCAAMFARGQDFCVAFESVRERFLWDFYMGESISASVRDEICRNLILACMASRLPYPLLYLTLAQQQIHLNRDGSVSLSCAVDLEDMDRSCTESQCASECALIVRQLLEDAGGSRTVGYRLLQRKLLRQGYQSFRELYTDLRLSAPKPARGGIRAFFRELFYKNQWRIFRFLLTGSAVLALLVLIMIVSSLIWGDIPLFRLFFNTFQKIGTESLVK